jgi:hypothetical protein
MRIFVLLSCVLMASVAGFVPAEETGKSHRPLRVAPVALNRALPDGPTDWPDPLRELDKEAPDRGAIPVDAIPLEVGHLAGQTGRSAQK